MLIPIFLLLIGLGLLIVGANGLVQGSSALARKYRIPELAIGLTIVAFGTSAPELIVNIIGSVQNVPDIVVGNVLGSNNVNLFLILGIAGLITPLTVQSSTTWLEIPFLLGSTILLYFLLNDGLFFGYTSSFSRWEGIGVLVLFVGFLVYIYTQLKTDTKMENPKSPQLTSLKTVVLIIGGLLSLVAGGYLVVTHATNIATSLNISEKIIGLTIVAAGTSLPELATSVVAAWKRNNDIAVGNVIGSNIFNLLFIFAISAVIRPISFNSHFNTDIYLMVGGTGFLFLLMFTGYRKKLDRWEAALLLVVFLVYTAFLISQEI